MRILRKKMVITDRKMLMPLQAFLVPISADFPVGKDLFYDPLYDQIKEARHEDDPMLSQGVWQRDLKKADWQLVEELCCEALSKKTKDLQIAGWLTEGWVIMNHLDGFHKGISLIMSLSEKFWIDIYPVINDNDKERRLHFYEWLDTMLGSRLSTTPLIKSNLGVTQLSLSDWLLANRLDNLSKRSSDPQKIIMQAEKKNEMTLSRLNQVLGGCSRDNLESLKHSLLQAIDIYKTFKKSLDKLLLDNSRPAMNAVLDTLHEMQRFIKAGLDLLPVASTSSTESDKSSEQGNHISTSEQHEPASQTFTRSNAYQMIGQLADFLQAEEPHSPAPALLKRISTWENKSIMDILREFGDSPETWAALAKLFDEPIHS